VFVVGRQRLLDAIGGDQGAVHRLIVRVASKAFPGEPFDRQIIE